MGAQYHRTDLFVAACHHRCQQIEYILPPWTGQRFRLPAQGYQGSQPHRRRHQVYAGRCHPPGAGMIRKRKRRHQQAYQRIFPYTVSDSRQISDRICGNQKIRHTKDPPHHQIHTQQQQNNHFRKQPRRPLPVTDRQKIPQLFQTADISPLKI